MLLLKSIHVTCVVLSYTLFLLRGIWLMRGATIMQQRWLKTAPHSIDSMRLASWLTAQIVFFNIVAVAVTRDPLLTL